MAKTLSVIIPCLNEEKTLRSVLNDCIEACDQLFPGDYEILVVDNGSEDLSREIVNSFAKVQLICESSRGYGQALHRGLASSNGNYVLTLDADCSYPMSNLILFKKQLEAHPTADVILGSRLRGHIAPNSMPFLNRYLGTPVLSFLIRWIWKLPVSDCNSGMRLIRRDFYLQLPIRAFGMNWASDVLVRAAQKSCQYCEVSILFLKDQRNHKSHLSRWQDGLLHLRTILSS